MNMRTFEIIILLSISILPFIKRPVKKQIKPIYIHIFFLILLGLHLVIEGWRWQMFPAYFLLIFLSWRFKVIDPSRSKSFSFPRIMGYSALLIIILIAWIPPIVLPVFSLPEPAGNYVVGTESIFITTGKDEIITKDPSDTRELSYKIWYPSETVTENLKPEQYIDPASRAGFATKYGLPPSSLNYLDLVKTHSFSEIPIAKGKFPVLIFSHGYGSKATGYYALLSELASQGYVIVNMNHTYESLGVTFPDGRRAFFNYEYQNEISEGSMDSVQPVIEAFRTGLDFEKRHVIVRNTVKNYFEDEIQNRWAEDMIYTLDQLKKWNAEGFLKNKLDLDRIGVFGHSVGGGSAGKVAMKDQRIKAAANLDGIQWGEMIDSTYPIPYLYVSADWPADHEDINSHIYINKSSDYFYESKLLNSGHPNFMDIPFMIPVESLSGSGEIDPGLGIEIVSKLLTSFFNKHLKGIPDADPVKISDQYDLLELKTYKDAKLLSS
ncbi:hypothetical protein ML462_14590 [Gramella lutea]|uniref:1-alkyl-2-acetylglycerophosphocholine esterase n=1 Tax=Christiangramia lutea TaxID=1607951 RepID=A0A9X2ACS5_9FLAO|nr:hypothetical protein [Christiangramia lutea]MCH4824398.1 hypothetical protein [Christiangramia lutea]